MSNDWINRRAARVIIDHLATRRPAWLWSGDGETLIWRNSAARLFLAKQKKRGIRLAKDAIPIKGQVRRLLRLGSVGLSSLARVRFLSGQKPVSATCTCTPLLLENDRISLLIVGVDKIEKPLFKELDYPDPLPSTLLGEHSPHVLVDGDGRIVAGSDDVLADLVGTSFSQLAGWEIVLEATRGGAGLGVPRLGVPHSAGDQTEPAVQSGMPDGEQSPASGGQLSHLMDQLSNDSGLFEPLGPQDDEIPQPATEPVTPQANEGKAADHPDHQEFASQEIAGQETAGQETANKDAATSQWRITGRGFLSDSADDSSEPPATETGDGLADVGAVLDEGGLLEEKVEPDTRITGPGEADTSEGEGRTMVPEAPSAEKREEVDRVARYNFDELARILGERVAGDTPPPEPASREAGAQNEQKDPVSKTIKLSDELLVLNRLPVGILIFRDQSILFANRTLADIMGGASISSLREGGLEAIFPRVDNDGATLGPVAALLDVNGNEVPVIARLQTILWQGKSALMLSAQRQPPSTDAESAIKAFLQAEAKTNNHGYIEADEAGTVRLVSQIAADLFSTDKAGMIGLPLVQFLEKGQRAALRAFLGQPAKFAETERPNLQLKSENGKLELNLFISGRAGVVKGIFGTVKPLISDLVDKIHTDPGVNEGSELQVDTQLLSRLSRGIRRPLNTIIGFSELIESEAFGKLDNPRYGEYSRDIKSAGLEISRLAEEIDEYVRLEGGDQAAGVADFDLGDLLDECLRLVRREASRRQVFVRSAISETLSGVVADRATLRQAVLNLLASAIDRTRGGGKVVLSAQSAPDGAIDVHVRNSGTQGDDESEHFVVFRESHEGKNEALVPVKSSIGLALTRSLLAVNACTLVIDLSAGTGTLMTLAIPAGRTVKRA